MKLFLFFTPKETLKRLLCRFLQRVLYFLKDLRLFLCFILVLKLLMPLQQLLVRLESRI